MIKNNIICLLVLGGGCLSSHAAASEVTDRQSAVADYGAALQQHIRARWLRPDTDVADLQCTLSIAQDRAGNVIQIDMTECVSEDMSESIRRAVLRSSPLPLPKDPEVFARKIRITFTAEN